MAPNDQSLTRFANAASLFTAHSICRGFQIPAAIPNTIDMISNFSNNPLSITSRQTIRRYLWAIQPEGNQNVVLPLKTHLRERAKVHRICPSTSRTSRPCLHAPAARHYPDSPSIPTRKDGVSYTDLRIERRPPIARKETDVTKKDPVWDASCDKISNQNEYSYHFSQNRVFFSLSRPISTTCVLSPRSSFFFGRMLYGYPDSQHRLQQKCVLHLEITMEAWLSHPFLHQLFNAPHLMMRLCRFLVRSLAIPASS